VHLQNQRLPVFLLALIKGASPVQRPQLASVLLKEKGLGNRVVIVDAAYQKLGEFKEVEPRVISEIAARYVRSVCPEMSNFPAALLVARLERERDENTSAPN
jgi:hypothetical protein